MLSFNSSTPETRYEARVRRRARGVGYVVRKCRSRNPERLGFGGYMLIDASLNVIVFGGHPYAYSATIEDIDAYFNPMSAA